MGQMYTIIKTLIDTVVAGPFGPFIQFVLVLGVALLFIGTLGDGRTPDEPD